MLKNLHIECLLNIRRGRWVVDGSIKECWIGRDSFKLANMLSMYYAGLGDRWFDKSARWIEHNQRLFGQDVILRVFGETGEWRGHPMFGSPPYDAGIWNIEDLQARSAEGIRIKHLTSLNEKVIERLMRFSQETGCAFEYVVDATLKHTPGNETAGNDWLKTSITDHAIRQTCEYMRGLMGRYPRAKIIVEARNEWRAHNKMRTKLGQVNMWAERMYRWERHDGELRLALRSPGPDWSCRQWPEGYIVVDGTNDGVNVGPEPGRFKMGLTHPDRDPTDRKWWEIPTDIRQLRDDCRGVPLGFNESKLYVDAADSDRADQWYRGKSYTTKLNRYLDWFNAAVDQVDYFIIHDEKGMQCDPDWPRPMTALEEEFGGYNPPTPPLPPEPALPDFRPIINQAYQDILNRNGDQGGLDHKNRKMQDGMTEADMREEMLRSEGYLKKNAM
jgi:hypothetical protein